MTDPRIAALSETVEQYRALVRDLYARLAARDAEVLALKGAVAARDGMLDAMEAA